jgi:hypothetical protein
MEGLPSTDLRAPHHDRTAATPESRKSLFLKHSMTVNFAAGPEALMIASPTFSLSAMAAPENRVRAPRPDSRDRRSTEFSFEVQAAGLLVLISPGHLERESDELRAR